MEANNINNDENHDPQQQVEQQQKNADPNDDDDGNNGGDVIVDDDNEQEDAVAAAIFLKLNAIICRRRDFPWRQRNRMVGLAEQYITSLGEDIHGMLCDQNDGDNYQGLDSNRDTEAEVETALHFYPHLLSRRKEVQWGRYEGGEEDAWIAVDD